MPLDDEIADRLYDRTFRINRLGRYATRNELLDEIRDLSYELDREKRVIHQYKAKLQDQEKNSKEVDDDLSRAINYQSQLKLEYEKLRNKYSKLKSVARQQKEALGGISERIERSELDAIIDKRRSLEARLDAEEARYYSRPYYDRYSLPREYPYLHANRYPYSYYGDVVYPSLYDNSYERKRKLERKMQTIQSMLDDLRFTNTKLIRDAKHIKDELDY